MEKLIILKKNDPLIKELNLVGIRKGCKMNPSVVNQISKTLKGRKFSDEHLRNLKIANKLKDFSYMKTEEYSRANSLRQKNRKVSFKTKLQSQYKLSKIIEIYNNKNELMFISTGNFEYMCKINKLPFAPLKKSYQNNGAPIFTHGLLNKMKGIPNSEIFIGWYAIISTREFAA